MTDEEIKYKNQLWYYKTYNQLVDKALKRGLDKKKLEGYYEKHHILPKCLGGNERKDNYVLFTYREHVIAHMLLQKMYPDNNDLVLAVNIMFRKVSDRDTSVISSKTLEYYKLLYIERIKGEGNHMYGKHLTKEHKRKMSAALSGERHYLYGKHHSEETKRKLSIAKKRNSKPRSEETKRKLSLANKGEKNPMYGKHLTEEHKRKISEAQRGRHQPRLSKEVIGPDGTRYKSIVDCSRNTNHDRHTISNWIKNNPEKGFRYYKEEETNH